MHDPSREVGNARNVNAPPTSVTVTMINAGLYVLSGCSQPLLMTICKNAGLADSSSQLYMLFYYLGPASVVVTLWGQQTSWPSTKTIMKACGIALFDICAQSLNYTGASLAGPTIFAIVYSSVTVWTAMFSRLFLKRSMNSWQWVAIVIVFGGLTLTATDSMQMGDSVVRGLLLVVFGSMMHALTYVFSEIVMTVGDEKLSVRQNCAVQGIVAASSLFLWQIIYTLPRWQEKIWGPMQAAETTMVQALSIFLVFALANLIHAMTFFHTLRHFPGGATSAGVMKGLQAVLVFVVTHVAYCGRTGGAEMCFSQAKFLSLFTVVGGVIGYAVATQERTKNGSATTHGRGYERIEDAAHVEIEPLS
jgi:drug/metabolite transporter (DMT)-like permease